MAMMMMMMMMMTSFKLLDDIWTCFKTQKMVNVQFPPTTHPQFSWILLGFFKELYHGKSPSFTTMWDSVFETFSKHLTCKSES